MQTLGSFQKKDARRPKKLMLRYTHTHVKMTFKKSQFLFLKKPKEKYSLMACHRLVYTPYCPPFKNPPFNLDIYCTFFVSCLLLYYSQCEKKRLGLFFSGHPAAVGGSRWRSHSSPPQECFPQHSSILDNTQHLLFRLIL